MGQKMQLGLQLPTYDNEMRQPTRWTQMRELACLAEEIHVDTLWVADHLLYQGNHERSIGFWEAWTVLSALAEATSHITIGPLVICSAFRNPALLAKMAGTLDEISNKRLLLGLGSGAERSVTKKPELSTFGYEVDRLVDRFEEAIHIIAGLLRQGYQDFQGRYYKVHDCELRPRGPSVNGPPIWIGAVGPRMQKIAARWADAFNLNTPCTSPDAVREFFARFDALCREIGRDPGEILHTGYTFITFAGPNADMSGRRTHALKGTPEEIAAQLHAFHLAGVEHMQCVIEAGEHQGPLSFWPVLTTRGIEKFSLVIEALRKIEISGNP